MQRQQKEGNSTKEQTLTREKQKMKENIKTKAPVSKHNAKLCQNQSKSKQKRDKQYQE